MALHVGDWSPPLLTAAVARGLLRGTVKVSLDLGLSKVEVPRESDRWVLPGGWDVGLGELEKIAGREGDVFFPGEEGLLRVAVSGKRFLRLLATGGAPTLEIDGVRMHRTRGVTPEVDAEFRTVLGARHS